MNPRDLIVSQGEPQHSWSKAERVKLDEKLRDLAGWLSEALDLAITKQMHRATNNGGHTGKRKATPLPYNEHAADIAYDLHGTLESWINQTCLERRQPHPGKLRIQQSARWLRTHLNDLSACQDTITAYDEICDAHQRAIQAVDKPLIRTYQGTCEICDAELWARRNDPNITCPQCARIIPKKDNDQRINSILESRLFTANELVSIVADRYGTQVKSKTIHDMAYRNTNPLTVRGHTYTKQPLYLAGEVFNRLRERNIIA